MKTHPAGRIRCKDDTIRSHSIVNKDLHSHKSRSATRHLGVEEQDRLVVLDTGREFVVAELWLTSPDVGLDKEVSRAAVGNDALQAGLERRATTLENDGRHFA